MNHHFPNELLKDSTKVVRAVWDKLRALQARDANGGSIDEERKDMGLYVMADTTYGSCVDEVGTAHINAECVIHYGHTCLSPGLTSSNYTELSKLYEKYKTQGLEILAFPCNQFAGQELGSNPEIKNFACTSFKVEFPIFDKVDVNGLFTAPVYQFLKSSSGGFLGDLIKWNFKKFLVDKNHSACLEGSWDWLLCSLLSYACKDVAAGGASLA